MPDRVLADRLQVLRLHLLKGLRDGLLLKDDLLDPVLDRLLQLAPVLCLWERLSMDQLVLEYVDEWGVLYRRRGEEVLSRLYRAGRRPEEASAARHVVDEAPGSVLLVRGRVLIDAVVERVLRRSAGGSGEAGKLRHVNVALQ